MWPRTDPNITLRVPYLCTYMYMCKFVLLRYAHYEPISSAINTCVDILLCRQKKRKRNFDVNEIIFISQKPWCLWVILEGRFAYLNNITHIKRINMWRIFLIFISVKICLRRFLSVRWRYSDFPNNRHNTRKHEWYA